MRRARTGQGKIHHSVTGGRFLETKTVLADLVKIGQGEAVNVWQELV